MILGAIENNAAFDLDETDLRKNATGYTADLLPRLQAKYPGAVLRSSSVPTRSPAPTGCGSTKCSRHSNVCDRAAIGVTPTHWLGSSLPSRRVSASASRHSTFRRFPNRRAWCAACSRRGAAFDTWSPRRFGRISSRTVSTDLTAMAPARKAAAAFLAVPIACVLRLRDDESPDDGRLRGLFRRLRTLKSLPTGR